MPDLVGSLMPRKSRARPSAKTRHQKVASETRGQNGASVSQFVTRRPSSMRELPRYPLVLRGFASWPAETGLAGWGDRTRTRKCRFKNRDLKYRAKSFGF